jgi:hypothetical protein
MQCQYLSATPMLRSQKYVKSEVSFDIIFENQIKNNGILVI